MKRIFKEVGDSHKKITEEMTKMKDVISKTFLIVADSRFKASIAIL